MPQYTYRRTDGTTFDMKQKFTDDPLTVDPESGQSVVRVVQAAGIIFKGSGFYVNDSRSKSTSTLNNTSQTKESSDSTAASSNGAKVETKTETKAEPKPEAKTPSPAAAAD